MMQDIISKYVMAKFPCTRKCLYLEIAKTSDINKN